MTAGDFPALIRRLASGGVEFIVIGGVAGAIHGSAHVTYDLDILYRRTRDNMERLATTLAPIEPYLRGAAPGPCISLRRLILLKRAAGRPRDMNVIAELEALLEERERSS